MKKQLMKAKMNFIKGVAPERVTHWNKDKNSITFFEINCDPVVIKKPLWLKMAEKLIYLKWKNLTINALTGLILSAPLVWIILVEVGK